MKLKTLVGSGEKIGLFTLPFLVVGLGLNILYPSLFSVGEPPIIFKVISIFILILGVIIWAWSAALIITKVPRKELITNGPFSLVKHPLYTDISLFVLPWIGFLLNSWLGVLLGIIVYIGTRKYAPKEEEILSKAFGAAWKDHVNKIKIPWL
jgi:protein-S-isoprenylcysteine O-methyltransferase Ste14